MKNIFLLSCIFISVMSAYAYDEADFACYVTVCLSAGNMPSECNLPVKKYYSRIYNKLNPESPSKILGACKSVNVDGELDPYTQHYIDIFKYRDERCIADKLNAKGKWIHDKKTVKHPLNRGRCEVSTEVILPNHKFIRSNTSVYRPVLGSGDKKYSANYCISTNNYQVYVIDKQDPLCDELWSHQLYYGMVPEKKLLFSIDNYDLSEWFDTKDEKSMYYEESETN